MKISDEKDTTIIPEQNFNFRSFRKMYLKLLPPDRAKIQFVLTMAMREMQYTLHKTKNKRFRNKE
jgi:hypothetical protein